MRTRDALNFLRLDPCGGRLLAALASGVLLDLSNNLAPWWLLAWIAPIPLLVAALHASLREAGMLAIVAGIVSTVSTTSYYLELTGILVTTLVTLLRVLSWALVVVRTRAAVLRSRHWLTVFVYPALWTGIDTLIATVSRHGTAGSLAYSQMQALPVIQVASLAGTSGIVFIVSLFTSVVAVAWYRRAEIERPGLAYGLPGVVLVGALAYGAARLAASPQTPTIPVGLAAIDYAPGGTAASPNEAPWATYRKAIMTLGQQGVKIIVLPEKIAALDSHAAEQVRALLGQLAAENSVYILAGVTAIAGDHKENRAWLFAPTGALSADYAKQHLVPGFEDGFRPGKELVVHAIEASRIGIAVCKDMDFSELGRLYAAQGVSALLVPAWDFNRDGWLHSRMAILRGVESGFPVVRSARKGLLTVSDRYGRILGEAASASGPGARLTAIVPLGPGEGTLYARFGNVFGWLCLALSVLAGLGSNW